MHYRNKLLAGAAGSALLLAASAASAADIVVPAPPAPPPIVAPIPGSVFAGPYIGAIIGAGMGDKFWDNEPYGPWGTAEHRVSGILLGVEAGFRFQPGNLVFGVEGDWAWTNIDGADACGPGDAYTCATELNWLATLTGQVGIAPDAMGGNLLLYGEAGFAWAAEDFAVTGDGVALAGAHTNSGWLVGGGAVFAMDNGLYIKGEYNFINFGTETGLEATGDGLGAEFDLTQRAHVFKVGVGFQF